MGTEGEIHVFEALSYAILYLVMFDSLTYMCSPQLLLSMDCLDKNTGVDCHFT